MMLNGHGHHHGHHGHGGQGYPPPPPSYGYRYGQPLMPQYPPPPPHYYAIPLQHHPQDNMFSDENPNMCSVM